MVNLYCLDFTISFSVLGWKIHDLLLAPFTCFEDLQCQDPQSGPVYVLPSKPPCVSYLQICCYAWLYSAALRILLCPLKCTTALSDGSHTLQAECFYLDSKT